jgi:replicative DNA helicase
VIGPITPREFAERALLGVLLLHPAQVMEIAGWLRPDDFRTPANGVIYRNMRNMVNEALHRTAIALATRGQPDGVTAVPTERSDVPGVTPVTLFDRISRSTELGDRSITAPYLHTLLATAPVTGAVQPAAYAQMVLEAAIRREVERSGLRVAQAAGSPGMELGALLATVNSALQAIDTAQHRSDTATVPSDVSPSAVSRLGRASRPRLIDSTHTETSLDLVATAPDRDEIAAAEQTVLGIVLARPDAMAGVVDRLDPDDFADRELGNAFRAAIDVHASAHMTGRQVDPVTVAWQQQRQSAQHGPGIPVERLIRITHDRSVGDLDFAVDVVMRARLTRLAAHAADAVQQAAQHPGLQPADLLHSIRLAYQAIHATADRMTGTPVVSVSARLNPAPADEPDQDRATGRLLHMRQRAGHLIDRLNGQPTDPGRATRGPLAHAVAEASVDDADLDITSSL